MNDKIKTELAPSLALFTTLYDKDQNIYNVIAELIKFSVIQNQKETINSYECKQLLKSDFQFDIPEAVILTCLKKLSKNNNPTFSKNKNNFNLINNDPTFLNSRQQEFNKIKQDCDEITDDISKFCQEKKINTTVQQIKIELIKYLANENFASNIIPQYVICKKDTSFYNKISELQKGYVIQSALNYCDINTIGQWNKQTTIYLDTEHLFSATGLNGEVYKTIFDEFHQLVQQANNSKEKKIILKYFPEIEREYMDFFHKAEHLLNNHKILLENIAMQKILERCQEKSDVRQKLILFQEELSKLYITLDNNDYLYKPESFVFNTEDKEYDNLYPAKEKNNLNRIFKIVNKINTIRGNSKITTIDETKAIFITNTKHYTMIAYDIMHKQGNNDTPNIPYAADINYITEKLWFKLCKSISRTNIPSSIDIIIKAQVALSAFNNKIFSENYKKVKDQLENGTLSQPAAKRLLVDLHNKYTPYNLPENIDTNSLTAQFFDENIDDLLKEYNQEIEKNKKEKKEKEKLRKQNQNIEKKKKLYQKNLENTFKYLIYIILLLLFIGICIYIFKILYINKNRDPLDWIIITITLASPLILFFKKVKIFINKIAVFCTNYVIAKLYD